MNRMEEYEAMRAKLEEIPPEVDACVDRAKARRRKQAIWKPLVSVAAVFCLFVGLVNVSPTVAAACREIPLLDRLVEAVTFSRSLQQAVENEYVQPMGLEETKNDVTVRVEHVIVDQKQVNIFYSITAENLEEREVDVDIFEADTDDHPCASMGFDTYPVHSGEMRHITVDYKDGTVPPQLRLWVQVEAEEFEFLLTFDPTFTAQGRIIEINRTLELDGNRFTIPQIEVYPTHLRLMLEEDPENASWLESLDFYLELPDGTRMEAGSSGGLSAFGDPVTPSMTTYMANSPYFDEAKTVKLVVTGADFREKDFENVYINLKTGETGQMPRGIEYLGAGRGERGMTLSFLVEDGLRHAQPFIRYYDAEGNQIESQGGYGTSRPDLDPEMAEKGLYLGDFTGDEIWLEPNYTYFWKTDVPVTLELPLQ